MSILGKIQLPNNIPEDTIIDTTYTRCISQPWLPPSDINYVPCGDKIRVGIQPSRVKYIERYRWMDGTYRYIERYVYVENGIIYPYALRIHSIKHTSVVVLLEQLSEVKEAVGGEYPVHESLLHTNLQYLVEQEVPTYFNNQTLDRMASYLDSKNPVLKKLATLYADEMLYPLIDECANNMDHSYLQSTVFDPLNELIHPSIQDQYLLDPITKRSMDSIIKQDKLRWKTIGPQNVDMTIPITGDKSLYLYDVDYKEGNNILSDLVRHVLLSGLTDIDVNITSNSAPKAKGYSRFFPERSKDLIYMFILGLRDSSILKDPITNIQFDKVRLVKTFTDQLLLYYYYRDEISHVRNIDLPLMILASDVIIKW